MAFAYDLPVIINCRDRVGVLKELVAWLEAAGHQSIVLLDNASTWEPMLEYLDQTPHYVVRLEKNLGSRALWRAGLVPSTYFIYTDPDVVPARYCPFGLVPYLHNLLEHNPRFVKAGPTLDLSQLPPDNERLTWERQLVSDSPYASKLDNGTYASLIDTTLALYRPGAAFTLHAVRVTQPYIIEHPSWYQPATAEDDYYHEHCQYGPRYSSLKATKGLSSSEGPNTADRPDSG